MKAPDGALPEVQGDGQGVRSRRSPTTTSTSFAIKQVSLSVTTLTPSRCRPALLSLLLLGVLLGVWHLATLPTAAPRAARR